MATYLDLANLANDGAFLARIAYAVSKYAAYIQNEDPGAPQHTARMNWEIKALNSPAVMASTLVGAVTRDANVVANLANVSDADLQTAVETAANTLIAAPVAYADMIALALDPGFLKRIQIAIAKFAAYILAEPPNTPNHPARYNWARTNLLNTQGVAFSLAPAIVVSENIPATLFATSDADLQVAVENEAQQLLM